MCHILQGSPPNAVLNVVAVLSHGKLAGRHPKQDLALANVLIASKGGAVMRQKTSDRSVRNLGALQRTASTSRVLNLIAVAAIHREDPAHRDLPFFHTAMLNECLVLKHRIRADERFVFDDMRQTATKIIIPFERTDLKMGGRSFFVGQRGWLDMLDEIAGDSTNQGRDISLLHALDELPSLDPFLLREHLNRRGFPIAACYFAISEADMTRMQEFVSLEINNLIRLAYESSNQGLSYSAKLVQVLLSTQIDERLEPLRVVLRLEGEAYREGVFSWKGFLYYKWVLSDLWPKLVTVLKELPTLRASGHRDPELLAYIDGARTRLIEAVERQRREVAAALKIYDEAFLDLTKNGRPMAFRDFLIKAPTMFVMLGERIGVISHIVSFWRYRFPDARLLTAPIDEVVDILQDFEANLISYEVLTAGR